MPQQKTRSRRSRQARKTQRKVQRKVQRGGEGPCIVPTLASPSFVADTLTVFKSNNDACIADAWEKYMDLVKNKQMPAITEKNRMLYKYVADNFYRLSGIWQQERAKIQNGGDPMLVKKLAQARVNAAVEAARRSKK